MVLANFISLPDVCILSAACRKRGIGVRGETALILYNLIAHSLTTRALHLVTNMHISAHTHANTHKCTHRYTLTHTNTHTHTHTRARSHAHIHTHTHTRTCTHTHTHTHTRVRTHMHTHTHTHAHMLLCTHTHTRVGTHMHTHTHTHTHAHTCTHAVVHPGAAVNVEAAVQAALHMASQGAGIIDIGGQSTRPGAVAVSVEQELARVLPVIRCVSMRVTWVQVQVRV